MHVISSAAAALLLIVLLHAALHTLAGDTGCYGFFSSPTHALLPSGKPCGYQGDDAVDRCFLLCSLCGSPVLGHATGISLSPACEGAAAAAGDVVGLATQAFVNATTLHGIHWQDSPGGKEENATLAITALLRYMPRRDVILLFQDTFNFLDFLVQHVRYALKARRTFPWAHAVSWERFVEAVLPYAVISEKRDTQWRWRPRFFQLLQPLLAGVGNITAAAHVVAGAIPSAALQGVLSVDGESAIGDVIRWESEVSPSVLSPQQVAQMGGSCTGTAVVLVAALRSVGVPARIAGCSQSIVRDDDHHWAEFWDDSNGTGPFGDGWHTKEGTSAGNEGGPWDAPSGPMQGCLKGTLPHSTMATIWASSWSSPTFMPTQWHYSSWAATWGHVGAVNRCGAYVSHLCRTDTSRQPLSLYRPTDGPRAPVATIAPTLAHLVPKLSVCVSQHVMLPNIRPPTHLPYCMTPAARQVLHGLGLRCQPDGAVYTACLRPGRQWRGFVTLTRQPRACSARESPLVRGRVTHSQSPGPITICCRLELVHTRHS